MAGSLSFNIRLPLRVNANARGHSRFQPTVKLGPFPRMKYRSVTYLLFKNKWNSPRLGPGVDRSEFLEAGLLITLTRVAPGELDGHDNLRTAMKPIVDGITDALGLKNDRDPRLTWAYSQQRGRAHEYAVDVRVEPRRDPCPTCGQPIAQGAQ
jgi:hypothetical protein